MGHAATWSWSPPVMLCHTNRLEGDSAEGKYQCQEEFRVRDSFKKILYLFIFREQEGGGEREGEKHLCERETSICGLGVRTCNSGMCPDWESTSNLSLYRTMPNQATPVRVGEGLFI